MCSNPTVLKKPEQAFLLSSPAESASDNSATHVSSTSCALNSAWVDPFIAHQIERYKSPSLRFFLFIFEKTFFEFFQER